MQQRSKLAMISGSSRGIGAGIAFKLAQMGWDIFVTGRSKQDVDLACEKIQASGVKAFSFVGDLTVEQEVNRLSGQIHALERPLDLLVANVGSGRSSVDLQLSAAETRRLFEVNFFSAITLCEKLIPFMVQGNIIFISSIAGCESIGAPIGYSAAKAALLAYSKGLAEHLAARRIRVNSISPGNVLFEGSVWADKIKANPASIDAYLKAKVPLNQFASTEDIAGGVEFILSNQFYTGQNLIIDGGQVRGFI